MSKEWSSFADGEDCVDCEHYIKQRDEARAEVERLKEKAFEFETKYNRLREIDRESLVNNSWYKEAQKLKAQLGVAVKIGNRLSHARSLFLNDDILDGDFHNTVIDCITALKQLEQKDGEQ